MGARHVGDDEATQLGNCGTKSSDARTMVGRLPHSIFLKLELS